MGINPPSIFHLMKVCVLEQTESMENSLTDLTCRESDQSKKSEATNQSVVVDIQVTVLVEFLSYLVDVILVRQPGESEKK